MILDISPTTTSFGSLAYSAVPIGLIALCVSATASGRRRPLMIGLAALGCYVATMYPMLFVSERLAARELAVPAGALAWIPSSSLSFVAVAWLAVRAKQGFGT
jgi:hypothetical protein